MKKYNKYKDSGIEWIGEIPEHWDEFRLAAIGTFTSSGIDKKIAKNEPEVKIINYTNVYGNSKFILDSKTEYMIVTTPQSKIDKHCVNKGDLIFTPSSETKEDIGLSAVVIEDLLNTAFSYHVLRFQFNHNMNLNFKKYLCNNNFVLSHFSKHSQGTTRQTLGREDFKNASVILPPLPEQTAIANFLDRKTAAIDKLIENKKKLIELYQEQKQAIINQAVTKGLDPDTPMKDSGIEWLGEIPEHWEVKKLKYLTTKVIDGSHSTPTYLPEGIPFLRVTDIQTDEIDLHSVKRISDAEHKDLIKRCYPQKDDVLLSKNGTIGITKVIDWDWEFSIFVSLCLIKFRDSLHNKYFSFYFQSDIVNQQIYESSKTTSVTNLHLDKIKELLIIQPLKEEQIAIVQYIDFECGKINQIIEKLQKQIELYQEYRTTLISEVVTGKVCIV